MAAPLIAGLIRGLLGRSASGAAMQTGGRAAATQAVRNKTATGILPTLTAAKQTAPPVQPAAAATRPDVSGVVKAAMNAMNSLSKIPGRMPAAAKKPDISALFQSTPSKGQAPPSTSGIVTPKPDVSPKLPQAGQQPASAAKPDSSFRKLLNAFTRKPATDTAITTSPASTDQRGQSPRAVAGAKPQIDFGRLMGMMGQPNAQQRLQETTSREQQEAADAAQEKEKQTLIGKSLGLTKKGIFLAAKTTGAVTLALFAVKKWTDSLVESRRELVMFNGRIAASIARLDIQKFQLGVKGAAATETTTLRLNEAIGEFRAEFQPIAEETRTAVNTIAFTVVKVATAATLIVKFLSDFLPGVPILKAILNIMEEEQKKNKAGKFGLDFVLGELKKQGPPPLGPKPPLAPLP